MNTLGAAHLSDEQFTECVIAGPGKPEDTAVLTHLAQCEQCRLELVRFTQSVNDFSTATLAWSESRPSVSLRGTAAQQRRQPVFAAARWALAALVLGVGIPVVWHRDHRVPATPSTTGEVVASEDSEAQIAEDNKMMLSVSMAIGVNEPSPVREYRLQAVRHNGTRTRTQPRSE